MIRTIFHVATHPEYESKGLKMEGRPWADPLDGMAVAHDILEHFPKDDGSTEHELMALGASIYVRDENNYYCQKGSRFDVAENIAADMPQQSHYMHQADRTVLKHPGNTRPLRTEWAEDVIQRVYQEGISLLRSEFADQPGMYDWFNQEKVIGWLRRGFQRAGKRYRGISPMRTLGSFMEIERQADQFLKHAEEWQSCRIDVNVRRCIVTLKEFWRE